MPTSNTCSGAQFPNECRTADQAAPFLISAMEQYDVKTAGEIAGILALVGFESVDMKFKHNVVPGRPGQGTVNMQEITYNLLYAKSISALSSQLAAITTVSTADSLSPDQANQVLALVQPDQYNFGSGPWFLTTQCSADVKTQLQMGTDAGFQAYMGCVGVTLTSDRTAYWTRAKTAFGLQ
jgi:hypothetical protein